MVVGQCLRMRRFVVPTHQVQNQRVVQAKALQDVMTDLRSGFDLLTLRGCEWRGLQRHRVLNAADADVHGQGCESQGTPLWRRQS